MKAWEMGFIKLYIFSLIGILLLFNLVNERELINGVKKVSLEKIKVLNMYDPITLGIYLFSIGLILLGITLIISTIKRKILIRKNNIKLNGW